MHAYHVCSWGIFEGVKGVSHKRGGFVSHEEGDFKRQSEPRRRRNPLKFHITIKTLVIDV
jgi:hypothetical protein